MPLCPTKAQGRAKGQAPNCGIVDIRGKKEIEHGRPFVIISCCRYPTKKTLIKNLLH
jgi:hypothetical protein